LALIHLTLPTAHIDIYASASASAPAPAPADTALLFKLFVMRGQTAIIVEMAASAIFLYSQCAAVSAEMVGYNRAYARTMQVR